MDRSITTPLLSLIVLVAICTPVLPAVLDGIDEPVLENYAALQLVRGAPALEVPSRILYRRSLELIDGGDWREARETLLLAARLSGNYPDPLFTLARVELLHGDSYFLIHLIEGFSRLAKSFHYQSLLAANLSLLIAASFVGALMIVLIALTVRHWPLMDHWLRERYTRRFPHGSTKLVGAVVLISLAAVRIGVALYTAVLFIALWPHLSRREKATVLSLLVMTAALSVCAPFTNAFFTALDPGSVTSRLSLVNDSGADQRLLDDITAIDDPAFRVEREYAIGTLLYRLNDYEGATRHLLAAVSERPDFAPAFLCLGNVYFMEGEYDKALAGYQSVIAVDSTSALAYYNIGQTYIKTMLFSKSSVMLQRAGKLGIERRRAANVAADFLNLTVYDEGFSTKRLWSVALREGAHDARPVIAEVLAPFLLFPFDRFWIVIAAAITAAIVIGRKAPASWHVFPCENCGAATCESCADGGTGVRLCIDCSGVIRDLSSVKVMEALLRHRRQKVWSRATRGAASWRSFFWPGAPFIHHGRPSTGAFIVLFNVGALLTLVWGGWYFKDPRALTTGTEPWKLVAPLAVLVSGLLLSFRAKRPMEQRSHRILPPEQWAGTKERDAARERDLRESAETAGTPPAVETAQPMGSFLDL